jgi:hypothetical protein
VATHVAHLLLLPFQLLDWPQPRGFITGRFINLRRHPTARGHQINGLLLLGHDAGVGAELLLPALAGSQ